MLTAGNWPSIVQKNLSLIFLDQYRDYPSMLPLLYRFKDAEQGVEHDLETGDGGTVPEFSNGVIPYDDIQEGYKKSVSEREFAYGIKITRRLLRNDLYGVTQDKTSSLADSFRALRETRGAYPFNNAFSAFTVGDGLSLCNSAHTSKYLGANQSNTSTLAFSGPNVFSTELSFKKLKTNRDNIMYNIPDTLLIPMDLSEKAFEILKSVGKVDVDVNNRNYLEGRYKCIIWDNFLTDTNNWFMLNSAMMKKKLVWREWEPVQFFRTGEFDTLVLKMAGYCSFEVSTVEWRWIYGNEVS